MEQRRFPRYQLATPLTGVVEQAGGRYSGSILNISEGGFYLHLSQTPSAALNIQGDDDYGEIQYANRNAYGFGNLVRIERLEKGVGVGFSWDRKGMDEGSAQLIADVVEEQDKKRLLGRVSTRANEILIAGHVSSALANDVFNYLRTVSAGKARLSLSECSSIDSSGVEMLLALRDRGVLVVNIGSEIESVIQRFQISLPASDKLNNDAG